MKNKALLLLALVQVMTLSCIRIIPTEAPLKGKSFCDFATLWQENFFFRWQWDEGKDNYLDSAIHINNYVLPRSNDERSKHELSLLKLSSLCAKNEYDKAFNFIDSIEFDDYEYSCYKQVILNRIHAMERQSVEDIPERNFYLREAVDLLHDYLTNHKVGFGSKLGASWVTSWENGSNKGNISGTDGYSYETTVENIASSIIVHEWYSHLMKRNGSKMHSHRLAYKNVINYKLLWDATTEDYKAFNLGALQYYTFNETGRDKVDKPYRRLYNLYYGKCFNNIKDFVDKCLLEEYATEDKGLNNGGNLHHTNDSIIVTYVNFSRLNKFLEYSIIYSPSNNCLTIHPVNNKDHVMIVQDDDKQKFISFIDEFYISKKSTIIEHKTLKDERVEYDIPCIGVSCFNGISRTIYSQTYLGDGEYELVFSPSFMDFQKLLIKLINEYDRNCINPKPPYRCRYY